MTTYDNYPRDMIGYGPKPPHAQWPDQARVALQFVLNYEEGGENNVLHGDAGSETFLSEIIGAASFSNRHMSMESLYEYGSRAGLWRLLRMFEERKLPLTVFGVSMALKRNPEAVAAFQQLGHEIACHGLRWITYQNMDEANERAHMKEAVDIIRELTGSAPQGWYTGRDSPQTRKLVMEHGGFRYDADHYGDDLPFWQKVDYTDAHGQAASAPQLIVPYTLDTNDMRFAAAQGFNSGTQFFDYLKDAFDVLYAEGDPNGLNQPKMLSIGLHCRIVGRPARAAALARFLDYVQQHDKVWITRRIDIAEHWRKVHPFAD
jgi:putative urate catabolism protein